MTINNVASHYIYDEQTRRNSCEEKGSNIMWVSKVLE
jgi:hypothetical protein